MDGSREAPSIHTETETGETADADTRATSEEDGAVMGGSTPAADAEAMKDPATEETAVERATDLGVKSDHIDY
jgi:hypothetical protein